MVANNFLHDITIVVGGRQSGKSSYIRENYDANSVIIVPTWAMKRYFLNNQGNHTILTKDELKGVIFEGKKIFIDDYEMFGYHNEIIERFRRYNTIVATLTPSVVYLDAPPTWYTYWVKEKTVTIPVNGKVARDMFQHLNHIQFTTTIMGEIIVKRSK